MTIALSRRAERIVYPFRQPENAVAMSGGSKGYSTSAYRDRLLQISHRPYCAPKSCSSIA